MNNQQDDQILQYAIREPAKWELYCPSCYERINLELYLTMNNYNLESSALEYFAEIRSLFCSCGNGFILLKPTRSNIKGLFQLIRQVIIDYITKR